MYILKSTKETLVISQAVALLGTVFVNPVVAQGYNFVDLNQSSQFFNEGNRNIEREIKTFEENKRLPKIQLPQDYLEPQNIDELNFLNLNVEHKLQPMSYSNIDSWDSSFSNDAVADEEEQ